MPHQPFHFEAAKRLKSLLWLAALMVQATADSSPSASE